MPWNRQSLLNFFSALGIALLSSLKLFFVKLQMFDKNKIYLNVDYLTCLCFASILNIYIPLLTINIATLFRYDEQIGKVWLRLNFTTYCACAQGQNMTISLFRKTEKGTERGKLNILLYFMRSFYRSKAYKGEGGGRDGGGRLNCFFNLICTHYVKGPLRMLRPEGKIWEKGTFFFRFNVFIDATPFMSLKCILEIMCSVIITIL